MFSSSKHLDNANMKFGANKKEIKILFMHSASPVSLINNDKYYIFSSEALKYQQIHVTSQ